MPYLILCLLPGLLCPLLATLCLLSVPSGLCEAPLSSALEAADGTLLTARVAGDGQWRLQPADSVPARYAACVVAYEDRRFAWHAGLDPVAVARALVANASAGRVVQGGSTLTQQVARLALGQGRRSWTRKMREAAVAIGLELTHSKSDILRLYATLAPYGGNVVGLEAAAWRLFARSPHELSWAECATLAVLPNAPAMVNVARNRPGLRDKRNRLLRTLRERGVIDHDTEQLASAEPLPERLAPMPAQATHLLDRWVGGGAQGTRRTHIDAALQRRLQTLAEQHRLRNLPNRVADVGIIAIEVATGDTVAYVGNALAPSPTCRCDMVAAPRSSGSTLKPFLLAAMLADGELTPQMLIADTPLDINGFSPQNFSHTFSGAVPAARALQQSLNVPLVRMLQQHGVGRFLLELRGLGFTTLGRPADHYGAALILGGAEVRLGELCQAYATLARGLLAFNARIAAGTPQTEGGTRRCTAASIYHTLQIMTALARPEEEAEWQQFSSMRRVAWKTGTSYGGRDAWAVGVTPTHVVGVWTGNATGEGRAGLTGVGSAAPTMFDALALLPDEPWFDEPYDDEASVALCHFSGCRAGQHCARRDTLRLPRRCQQAPVCPYCRPVALSNDGLFRGHRGCLPGEPRVDERFVLPPTIEYYYAPLHPDYQPLPPLYPGCADNAGPEVIYPSPGLTVVRARDFEGVLQPIVAQAAMHMGTSAATRGREATLYWHLDGAYLGATNAEHRMTLEPDAGRHALTVVDDTGNETQVIFNVK